MTALASRTGSARVAMWGELWRIETMIERGQLASAAEGLAALHAAADRVGGPVAAWHHDRVAACIAEAQGRYADASAIARRAFQRMHPVEPGPARGSFFALQATLTGHIGVTDDVAPLLEDPLRALPRFQTMGHLTRAFLLHCAGRDEQAAASYQGAGPVEAWGLPVFYVAPCCYFAIVVAAALGWREDVAALLARLEPSRGGHASGDGVIYLGPVELALGRGEAALGELDRAIDDLAAAAAEADRAGARGFAAEARYHLATALLARDQPGDSDRARAAASHANRMAQALGMAAYTERTAALLAPFDAVDEPAVPLSRRELEVAGLVAEGLTNRQIAGRLVISERTAQNHVQHILTKLGFTTRSQIAAWAAGARK